MKLVKYLIAIAAGLTLVGTMGLREQTKPHNETHRFWRGNDKSRT